MVARRVTGEFNQPDGHGEAQALLVTRLGPPAQQSRLLPRPRVTALLAAAVDFPLTLVLAPAGSGKTTALAGLVARGEAPVAWCRLTADDTPTSLLYHLAAALRTIAAIDVARITGELRRGDAHERSTVHSALDILVNELAATLQQETLLILDDYHLADQRDDLRGLLERLFTIQPMRLHVILATRYEPEMGALVTARARGEVYQVTQSDLAFTAEETEAFFARIPTLPSFDVIRLHTLSRGWPLLIQIVSSENGAGLGSLSRSGIVRHSSLLDDYFMQQVFAEQSPLVQKFLVHTAGLRWLDPDIYAVLPDFGSVDEVMQAARDVERRNLFLETQPSGQRSYQPLFRTFLEHTAQQQLSNWREMHEMIADHYRQHGDQQGAIHHLLEAGDEEAAARELEAIVDGWLAAGQISTVLHWLDQLGAPGQQRPLLLEARARANRQLGRFERALQIFEQAEAAFQQLGDQEGRIRALRGRAEIYLDIVQPAPAVVLLKQALKLLPRDRLDERADLLRLQAENWANSGRADVALILENSARELEQQAANPEQQPGPRRRHPTTRVAGLPAELPPRLLLRSGLLNEARRQLEAGLGLDHSPDLRADSERMAETSQAPAISIAPPGHPLSMHREPLLLLSLIYAMLGEGPRAVAMARRGLLEAQQGASPLTVAIAQMRVAHAYQLLVSASTDATARQLYLFALDLVNDNGVIRTRAEACMGLTLYYGHTGELSTAETYAREGLQIAEAAGDEWMVALIMLGLAGAGVVAGDERAPDWLEQARQRFVRGGDTYGLAVTMLWEALASLHNDDDERLDRAVSELLNLVRQHGYAGLLTAPTLFGPRDMAMLVPLLLRARSQPEHAAYAQQLLRQAFPSIAADEMVEDYHPGYTLRVQMLGNFRVWRGAHEIQSREWQREKARQLFQLLLTHRGHWLQREQICSLLWPDSDLDAAERQFKVTLNALNAALEPKRPPRTAPFFIRRQGLAYSFAPSYGVWIDVDEFELRVTGANTQSDPEFALRSSQIAVQLYKGDYLAEALYDSWTLEERERLLARFLATTTTHAGRLVEMGELRDAIQLCEQVLRRDRCYEEAYQVLMRAHARSGSRSQALRSYSRCVLALRDDLGIEPLPETTELCDHIKRNEKI